MAIYQPINVYPSIKAIDILRDNTFSVEINTSDSVIAYQLTILDWDNNIVLEADKVILEEPLYNGDVLYFNPILQNVLVNGNDYKWRLRLYQTSPSIFVTSGYIYDISGNDIVITKNINVEIDMYIECLGIKRRIVNIVEDEDLYTLVLENSIPGVSQDNIFTIYSEFLDTTPEYVLYARTTPSIGFSNFINEVSQRNFILKGFYIQKEEVPLVYYQIILSVVQNNVARAIYDTGKVYRADIKLEYDGYITGNTYQLELNVLNEAGVLTTTGVKTFTVKYDTVEFLTEPQLYLDCRRHAIAINWTTPINFDPTLYGGTVSYEGVVGGITGSTIQIEKGLSINIGDIVIFNSKYQNEVSVYNAESGLLALRYATEKDIENGTPIIIINTTVGESNLNISLNDPYRMTNSAYLGETVLKYQDSEEGYIGKTPEKDNITFQFKLPETFWQGYLTSNMRLLPILQMETEEDNIRGFEVFVNLNKLVYIKPAIDGTDIYKTIVEDINYADGTVSLKLSNPIDFVNQKYLRFDGYNDIIEIVAYDNNTQTAILFEVPNIEFTTGNSLKVYDTLTYNFYVLLSYFPLQEQGTWNSTYDYIWDDKESWDDQLYWFEGGGAQQRIANTWFKTRINGTEMDVRAGGV